MAYEIKNNEGSLFENDKREKETQPHYKGKVNIEGILYWVSEWEGHTKGGKKIRNLKFTKVEETEQPF